MVENGQESISPYVYVFNDPVKNTDPDGREPDDDPPGKRSMAGNFVKGLAQSAWGTVTNTVSMVAHPINTLTAINSLNSAEGALNLGTAAFGAINKFTSGNGDVKANMLGQAAGDVAQLFIGAGEVKTAGNAIKGAKVAEEASAVARVSAVAETSVLSAGETSRIGNAATRINKPITVVGSRASGTAKAGSDWDYVIPNMTNKEWKKVKNSLPGAPSRIDNMGRNMDIFKGAVDKTKPNIVIKPNN